MQRPADSEQSVAPKDASEYHASLIRRITDGDHGAFTVLFDLLAPTALGLLVRILGHRSLAEDVLQDVFLQVWKQAGLYRPERGSVRGWLFTIARSRGLDRLRRERSWREEPIAEGDEQRWAAPPAQAARLETSERRRSLLDALGDLPPNQRVCLELALFKGLSQTEIAARLSAPLGTVKSRIRLGMAKIHEELIRRDTAPVRACLASGS